MNIRWGLLLTIFLAIVVAQVAYENVVRQMFRSPAGSQAVVVVQRPSTGNPIQDYLNEHYPQAV